MNRKKEIQEELESISPLLAKMDRAELPEVPYLYFDKLAGKVMDQVDEKELTSSWWSSAVGLFVSRRGLAFASVAFVAVVAVLFLQQPTDIISDPFADLGTDEINEYIAMNVDDFEESALYEYTDMTTIDIDFLDDNLEDSNIDDIMDDLIDDIDLETIEEFL